MTTFVLVHGAFRGGWSWRRVRTLLRDRDHDAWTPSLTGMGDRAHLNAEPPALSTWIADITELLHTEDLTDVVLVGHSQGGLVVGPVAATSERVAVIAYLDAPSPSPGQRGVDVGPGGPVDDSGLPPRDTWIPPTPLVPGDDLDDDTAAWMNERLCPTPIAPSLDPAPAGRPGQPVHHAFCARTPPGFPAAAARKRLDDAAAGYTVLDAGHDAPMTRPDLVTDWLTGLTG